MGKVYCIQCVHLRSCNSGYYCFDPTGSREIIPGSYLTPEHPSACPKVRYCQITNKANDCPDFEQIKEDEDYNIDLKNLYANRMKEQLTLWEKIKKFFKKGL